MAGQRRSGREVLRTAFYALWGLLTLVLLFTVGFLVVELVQRDQQLELNVPRSQGPSAGEFEAGISGARVTLFFADPARMALKPESRTIELTERTLENCRRALEALAEGPRLEGAPVLAPTTTVRAVYLLQGGELVVDFARDVETPGLNSASAEWLMAQAVAHTLTQPALQATQDKYVATVRFLFEGSPADEGFPKHITLQQPVVPDPDLVGTPRGAAASE